MQKVEHVSQEVTNIFFLISGIFLLLSDLISLNAFILHPWLGPILSLLGLILPLLISQGKGLKPFPLPFDHSSLKGWEKAPCPQILSMLSALVLLTDFLYSGGSATTVFWWCPSIQCNCYRYCHDRISHTFPFPATRCINGTGRGSGASGQRLSHPSTILPSVSLSSHRVFFDGTTD